MLEQVSAKYRTVALVPIKVSLLTRNSHRSVVSSRLRKLSFAHLSRLITEHNVATCIELAYYRSTDWVCVGVGYDESAVCISQPMAPNYNSMSQPTVRLIGCTVTWCWVKSCLIWVGIYNTMSYEWYDDHDSEWISYATNWLIWPCEL